MIYFFLNNINEDEIINNLQNNQTIIITKNKDAQIEIFPKINILANYNFNNLKNNIVADNLNIEYTQSLINSSGILNIKTNNLTINKLYFNEIIINSKISFLKNYFLNNYDLNSLFDGNYKIKGKFILLTSSEEKFIISFLKLFFEKLEKNSNNKFAFSTLLNTLNKNDSFFKGSINKKNNILNSNKILIQNNDNKITLSGQYDLINENIKFNLDLEQNNIVYLSAKITGNINSPKIIFDKDSNFFKEFNHNENNIIEESIIQFLDNFL